MDEQVRATFAYHQARIAAMQEYMVFLDRMIARTCAAIVVCLVVLAVIGVYANG